MRSKLVNHSFVYIVTRVKISPLDCKEIQPVHSEGDQPWDLFGRNDAKAEAPVLWAPHAKSWLIGKDSDAGRDWGREEKGMTEDEMAGWHHWLDGRESELNWYWEHEPRASPSKNYQLLECKNLHTENKRKHLCWTLHWVSVHVAEKKDCLQWI